MSEDDRLRCEITLDYDYVAAAPPAATPRAQARMRIH